MPIGHLLQQRFQQSVSLYEEFLGELPESALAMKLPGLRSNRIGAQLWCVIGARESFARAIEQGAWQGFSCSVTAEESGRKDSVLVALRSSGATVHATLQGIAAEDDARHGLVLDLLEHEAAHRGQLIRYLYGLSLPIPSGWKAHYALEA